VKRLATELDKKTTKTGSYIRVGADEIKEKDPWGTKLDVSYSQGGVAEMVIVTSAGPDREFHTRDDITAQGIAANLKGIGEGIKQNAEETASKVASGLVKGTAKGVKDVVKDAWNSRKKKAAEEANKEAVAEAPAQDEKGESAEKP
jgi:hypothetical protein